MFLAFVVLGKLQFQIYFLFDIVEIISTFKDYIVMDYIGLRSYQYLVALVCANIDLLTTSKCNIDTTTIKLLFVLNVPFSSLQILPQLLQ